MATGADLYRLVERYIGEIKEIPGPKNHPFIEWCHMSTTMGEQPDEISWCSSGLNRFAWELRLPRSKSAAARSWLGVGQSIAWADVRIGDVVILKRGPSPQPGPEVLNAPGHATLYSGPSQITGKFMGLGCNQSDGITVAPFNIVDVLGVRRLG